ncbi:MAG: phytanoyl-CoA dioxygenase family protein [Pseudomonadota bacterium]
MSQAITPDQAAPGTVDSKYLLSEQQIHYFDTFGYLKLPGLFADDIDEIIAGFEDLFGNDEQPVWETQEALHGDERRVIIPGFIEQAPRLAPLQHDPRVVGVVQSLIGPKYQWQSSDGNLFYCESYWHSDMYSAPLNHYHIKLSFYLDELNGESGAIRIIPGSQFHNQIFARTLRRDFHDPSRTSEIFGVSGNEIPSITVNSTPGDLVVWNFRTVHGSYNGNERRRLFSLNFSEVEAGRHDGPDPIKFDPTPYRQPPSA